MQTPPPETSQSKPDPEPDKKTILIRPSILNCEFASDSTATNEGYDSTGFSLKKLFFPNTHAGRADRLSLFVVVIAGMFVVGIALVLFFTSEKHQLAERKMQQTKKAAGMSATAVENKIKNDPSIGVNMFDQMDSMERHIKDLKNEKEKASILKQNQEVAVPKTEKSDLSGAADTESTGSHDPSLPVVP